jgi:hypothetical protein
MATQLYDQCVHMEGLDSSRARRDMFRKSQIRNKSTEAVRCTRWPPHVEGLVSSAVGWPRRSELQDEEPAALPARPGGKVFYARDDAHKAEIMAREFAK